MESQPDHEAEAAGNRTRPRGQAGFRPPERVRGNPYARSASNFFPMAFKIITVPLPETQDREKEVNEFLSNHAVVGVQRRFIEKSDEAYVVFLIEYAPGTAAKYGKMESEPTMPRKDWKAELGDDEFRVFNLLRDERAKMGEEEGIKVFNIFTNAQLVEMVKRKVTDPAALAEVPQVGEGRIKKYAGRMLAILQAEYGTAMSQETTEGAAVE
jgi:superfamily II DNA helicase RecQ